MKNLNLMMMSVLVLGAPAAFGQNLGQLNEHQLPKNLMSANEFLSRSNLTYGEGYSGYGNNSGYGSYGSGYGNYGGGYGDTSGYGSGYDNYSDYNNVYNSSHGTGHDTRYGTGYIGYGTGYTGYGMGYDTGYGNGYTGYGEYSGYTGYGNAYPSYYYLYQHNNSTDVNASRGLNDRSRSANAEVSANTPVVCFASDSLRNWYINVGPLSNVAVTQQSVNHECQAADASCVQNLGCAVAVDNR